MPKDYLTSKDVHELVSNHASKKANRTKKLKNGFIDKVNVFLAFQRRRSQL
jgi:hypothetical protein